jgi:hypothetical protein
MDTSIIVNLYFHLYPVLLLYDGAHVPIIPVGNIFDQVEPKKWENLLLAFSKLLSLIVNNRKLDDTLETTSDITAFKAAHMFQSCLSLTKKEDLPFVVNHLLGNKGYTGGSRNDKGFDLYTAFETRMDGGGPTENAAAPGSAPSALVASAAAPSATPSATPSAASPDESSALAVPSAVRALLSPGGSNLESMMANGLNYHTAGEIVEQARAVVDAAARIHELKDAAKLSEQLSEEGPYSTANLSALLSTLTEKVDSDIRKLEKFSTALKRTNFRINNINNPLSSIDFSNIKDNPRLTRIVRLIDEVLQQNPIQGEINKAKIQRRELKNQLQRKMRDRVVLTAIAATTVVGAALAYYSTPMEEPQPTPAASPALDVTQSTFMAGAKWMWDKGIFGVAGAGIRKVATGVGSAARDLVGEATGLTPLTGYVISNVQTGVNFLRANFGRLRNAAATLGAGGVAILTIPLWNDYKKAKSNLLQVEEDERQLLSKFRNTFVNLMISKYKDEVNSEIRNFAMAIGTHRMEFAMVLRVSPMERILELYEKGLDTNIRTLGFDNLALLLNKSEYSRFQADMTSLLESNKGLSSQIVKDFFTKLSATDKTFSTLGRQPLKAVEGITGKLASLTMRAGSIATAGVSLAAGAAMGGHAGFGFVASQMAARASGAALAARGGPPLFPQAAPPEAAPPQAAPPQAAMLALALQTGDPRSLPADLPVASSLLALYLQRSSGEGALAAARRVLRADQEASAATRGALRVLRNGGMRNLSLGNRGGSRTRKLKKHTKLTRRRY